MDSKSLFHAIHHVAIIASDYEKSRHFYVDLLGFEVIRENYRDKEEIREDMHTGDTVQEKLSLVYRFGVTIYFGAPSNKEFQEIVLALAKRYGIDMPKDELLAEANKWELSHGGLSGRTAQQFVDYLQGMQSDI